MSDTETIPTPSTPETNHEGVASRPSRLRAAFTAEVTRAVLAFSAIALVIVAVFAVGYHVGRQSIRTQGDFGHARAGHVSSRSGFGGNRGAAGAWNNSASGTSQGGRAESPQILDDPQSAPVSPGQ